MKGEGHGEATDLKNEVHAHHPRCMQERIGVLFYKICMIPLLINIILHGRHLYVSFSLSLDLAFHNASIFCDFTINLEPSKFHSQTAA